MPRTTHRDGSSTYVFDTYGSKPVYHAYGRMRDDKDVTVCGLVMWERGDGVKYAATLPRFRADLIAQPCRKCFR